MSSFFFLSLLVEEKDKQLELVMNETDRRLVCADDVNLLGENVNYLSNYQVIKKDSPSFFLLRLMSY